MQPNMAAGARKINMGIRFTNRKFTQIHSESVGPAHSPTTKEQWGRTY